jgi:hypothetical protein
MAKMAVKYVQLFYVKLVNASGLCLCLFSTYALQPSRLTVRSELEVPTPRLSPCESTQRRAAEGGTVGEKCPRSLPKMPNSMLHLGIFYMP